LFFFQAEDGIRDFHVTGVQTCALPISTTAGSVVLADAAPAAADCPAVARLRRAGAALVGHTNMSEFAFSGVGINPHHGTPANPEIGRASCRERVKRSRGGVR